ncbi:MAG: diguanylate cyclase with and sensor [Chthonomonadales bacterium]|nr:diguanylate cyclase with and sensor [Chthonomonadales bacterium]
MKTFRERKSYPGIVVISLLMALIGIYAYDIPEQQMLKGIWVGHTMEVQNQLETLSGHLTTAETCQRGYLLTGQPDYLTPYSPALHAIENDLIRLRRLTRDNVIQQSQMPGLHANVAARVAEFKETIDLRQSLGAEAALKVVRSGRGRTQMEAIQRQIQGLQSMEQRLLTLRRADRDRAVSHTRLTFVGGIVLLYCLLCLIYAVMQKQTARRKRLLEAERCATEVQRKEAERLAQVVSIQRDVASARQELQAAMQTIMEGTQEITRAEGAVVALVEGEDIIFRAGSGMVAPHLGLRLNAATSLSGRCVRENVLFKCDDAETDDRVDQAACRKIGLRSMVVVPLQHSGQAIGVLTVVSSRCNAFTAQDVATLELMAGVLSSAVSDATATQTLRESQERLEEAQQVAHVGSWEFDCTTRKIRWSKELFHLVGLAPEQGEPDYETLMTLYTPESADALETCVRQATQDGIEYAVDLQAAPRAGRMPRWFHAVGKPVRDTHGKVTRLTGTLLDITERICYDRDMEAANEWLMEANALLKAQKVALGIANARLEALATTDGLTGLKNHRAFQERLTEEFQRALRHDLPLSVVLLDVDHFKRFNDTFGHPEGDAALRQVADVIMAIARASDLVARYGGEEFVLLLPETDAHGALQMAERIRQAVAEAAWKLRAITVSVGVATFTLETDSAQRLVDLADRALYHSKRHGRDQVTHIEELAMVLPAQYEDRMTLQDKPPLLLLPDLPQEAIVLRGSKLR